MSNQIITYDSFYNGVINKWTQLEGVLNANLSQLGKTVTQVIGANMILGANPVTGSIFLTTSENGENGRSCQVKIWNEDSNDDLETSMTAFLESSDFTGSDPVFLSIVPNGSKWAAMLVYLTEGGIEDAEYTAYAVEDTDAEDMNNKMLVHLDEGDDRPLLYDFTYDSDGKNRAVVIYTE